MKQHYAGLDGLRGLAALAVMFMHEIGIFRPGIGPEIHGYIAVDMFFMLSGFVLAFAYDPRLDRGMTWREFMTVRLVRLHPMLLVAVALAALVAVLKIVVQGAGTPDENPWFIPAGIVLFPLGWFLGSEGAFLSTFSLVPFAGPGWSLLFEYVISALFATRLRRLGRGAVALFIVGAAGLSVLTVAAGEIGRLGLQGYIGVPGGLFRVVVPFMIGVFLFRKNVPDLLPRFPVVLTVIAGGALCCLPLGPQPMFDLVCVFFLFPLVICLGAQPTRSAIAQRVFALLGALSYPVYLLHVPVSRMVGFVAKTVAPSVSANTLIVLAMIGSVAGSFLALYLFDEPVRRWLTARLRRHTPLAPTPPLTGALPSDDDRR